MKLPPNHWKRGKNIVWNNVEAASVWHHPLAGLTVLRSMSYFTDGSECVHVSVSRPDRLPTWEEVSKVKEEFIGTDINAYHVIPARRDYVNVHKFCLHIWTEKTTPVHTCEIANLQDLKLEKAV